jgi:ADP-ribosylglycohydrolase
MLVEGAIGDAYGVAFEISVDADVIAKHNDLTYKRVHPSLIKAGCYTDDTQMMIAIVEQLLSDRPWSRQSIADHFVECFARDERRGYSGAFYNILLNVAAAKRNRPGEPTMGEDLLARVNGESDKCGAAMRAAPLGLITDLTEMHKKCDIQSSITHNTPGGKTSALAVALMTHYCYYELGPLEDLHRWYMSETTLKKKLNYWGKATSDFHDHELAVLDEYFIKSWPEGQRASTNGWECVLAAKQAVLDNRKMSQILHQVVGYSGDTDTTACIALSIASVCPEVKNDLPQRLYDGLENGEYGLKFLEDLDRKLFAEFG